MYPCGEQAVWQGPHFRGVNAQLFRKGSCLPDEVPKSVLTNTRFKSPQRALLLRGRDSVFTLLLRDNALDPFLAPASSPVQALCARMVEEFRKNTWWATLEKNDTNYWDPKSVPLLAISFCCSPPAVSTPAALRGRQENVYTCTHVAVPPPVPCASCADTPFPASFPSLIPPISLSIFA